MTISETTPPLHTIPNGAPGGPLIKEPLKYKGLLDPFNSYHVTPLIGTEFPDANVVDWLKAPNSDELLQDLAVTSMCTVWRESAHCVRVRLTRMNSFPSRRRFFPSTDGFD